MSILQLFKRNGALWGTMLCIKMLCKKFPVFRTEVFPPEVGYHVMITKILCICKRAGVCSIAFCIPSDLLSCVAIINRARSRPSHLRQNTPRRSVTEKDLWRREASPILTSAFVWIPCVDSGMKWHESTGGPGMRMGTLKQVPWGCIR